MKSVLISIRPKWVKLIASGRKTIEIRKSRPKLEAPFKCYIYETKGKVERPRGDEDGYIYQEGRGAVVGEFVCDSIQWNGGSDLVVKEDWEAAMQGSCLRREELFSFLGITPGTSVFDKRCEFYAWHISAMKMYDGPKALREFTPCCKFMLDEKQCDYRKIQCLNQQNLFLEEDGCNCLNFVKRPPLSYMYVEELTP